jgi:nitric oxide reductase NorQ protein
MSLSLLAGYVWRMQIITPAVEDYTLRKAPFYLPIRDEVDVFEKAHSCRLPVMLAGPTGCGKTRFVEYMAHKLGCPLVTVACHEDLTASDLLGRFLILGDETVWCDGPLATAVRHGAIVYLDEVVEARNDTLVAIHPLTDHRRMLPIEKLGKVLRAPDAFMLVMSYNPGYQSLVKELKPSTRQRFLWLDFDYPPEEAEVKILKKEGGANKKLANSLVTIARGVRRLRDRGLEEGLSTRLLVYAAQLIAEGLSPNRACEVAFVRTLSEDLVLQDAIRALVNDHF